MVGDPADCEYFARKDSCLIRRCSAKQYSDYLRRNALRKHGLHNHDDV